MGRQDYLDIHRDKLLSAYLNAEGKNRMEILRKIINFDCNTNIGDSYGKRDNGCFTFRKNKIIYINH
ncbi:MAG: hypothetical protein PWQ82_1765 [Thermosediminibacterales bacterium]|nr:hypothetical protein [Thermosediminibacterales bacterium]MDK2836158.1 hypothetical protein [Thermosediminibacterales bacterium]